MPWYSGIITVPVQGVSNVQRRIRSKEELLRRCLHYCITVMSVIDGILLHAGSDAVH